MSCSSDEQSDKECPLCMEVLEFDDLDFYPCKCEYQICRFCWHRIRTDENGLCPACRQPYPEDPVNFKPLSTADLKKIRSEKKMKAQAERQRVSESRKHLSNFRVLQKNLVYVVGLSPRVADPDILKKPEYFGRFGKILKVVVGTTTTVPPNMNPSHTAYVTYSKVEEAMRTIQSVNNAALDGRLVRASLGTTKYCSSFLRSQPCYKQECMYLHEIADSDISFTKEDMHQGKHADYERRLMEQVLRTYQTPVAAVTPTIRSANNSGSAINSISGDQTTSQARLQRDAFSDKDTDQSQSSEELAQILEDKAAEINEASDSKEENNVLDLSHDLEFHEAINEDLETETKEPATAPDEDSLEGMRPRSDNNQHSHITSRLHTWTKGSNASDLNASGTSAISWQSLLGLDHVDNALPSLQDSVINHPLFPVPAKPCNVPPPGLGGLTHPGFSPNRPSISKPTTPPPGLGGFGSDDELGFDPFSESAKGLADLLEEEKRNQTHVAPPGYQANSAGYFNHYSQTSTSQPIHNSLQENISRQNFLSSLQYQRERQEVEQVQREQWLRSMNNYPPQQQLPQRNDFFSARFGAANGHFNSSPKPIHQTNSFDIFANRFEPSSPAVAPPPGLAATRQNSFPVQGMQPFQQYNGGLLPSNSIMKGPSLNEWQEGFKALLPNVNIRFTPDTDQARWSHGSSQPLMSLSNIPSAMPTPLMGADQRRVHTQHIPPPPGFTTRSGER